MIIDRVKWSEPDQGRKHAIGGWHLDLRLWGPTLLLTFVDRREGWGWLHPAYGFRMGYDPRMQERSLSVHLGREEWRFSGHLRRPWGPGQHFEWFRLSFTRSK